MADAASPSAKQKTASPHRRLTIMRKATFTDRVDTLDRTSSQTSVASIAVNAQASELVTTTSIRHFAGKSFHHNCVSESAAQDISHSWGRTGTIANLKREQTRARRKLPARSLRAPNVRLYVIMTNYCLNLVIK